MNTHKKLNSTLKTLFSILLLCGAVGCESEKHKESTKLMVTSPWKTTVTVNREYVAQIRAIQHIEIRAIERGYLQKIFVDEGQVVNKDDSMFQIMPTINEAELKKRKAEYDLANIEYKNTNSLFKQKVVSANELALAKARLDKAKAELDLAQIHLNFTMIKAPFTGMMDRFRVRLGSLVEEGELLTTLSDNSQMWVYFNVSEADYLNFMAHKKADGSLLNVQLVMANGKLFAEKGKIDTIEADFNNETGNVPFRATFPNPESLLRHGETGKVLVTEPLEDVLVIPQKSTFEILDKKYVYVVNAKNQVQQREIVVGEEVPHLFVVTSGLKENEKIILEGIGKVEQGQKIEPDFIEPAKAMGNIDLPVK
ncbi:MAG: efflux RND transporter periplasmic adaptor subunit [Bdellovibrionaceae bacterium]|nr:efflux RND transporter periplasmic adaptor subunit [Pseudobdellovibrionaceae bacterium]